MSPNIFRGDYFAESRYFKSDVQRGVITNRVGKRFVCLTEDFLGGFREALVEECGEAANEVLYSCGRVVGELVASRLERELADFYGQPLKQLTVAHFDGLMRSYFSHHGWGRMHMSYEQIEQGLLVAEFESAIFQSLFPPEEKPLESLLAGFLAGLYSTFSGQNLDCLQTACQSLGAPRSLFVLGLDLRIARARPLVEAGENHEQVIGQLASIAA